MKTFEAKPSVVRVTNLPLNLLFLKLSYPEPRSPREIDRYIHTALY